jgi:hydrogenase maturation factor
MEPAWQATEAISIWAATPRSNAPAARARKDATRSGVTEAVNENGRTARSQTRQSRVG